MAEERPVVRPDALSPTGEVNPGAAIIVDQGATVNKATPLQVVDAAIPLATQAEAEAGDDNAKRVTPLRVKQAIDAQALSREFISSNDPGEGASAIGMEGAGSVQDAINVSDDLSTFLSLEGSFSIGSMLRLRSGYTYEVMPQDTPAFNENSYPSGYHLQTAGGVKLRLIAPDYVSPEMLDGDLHMAAAYAAVFKVTLMTGPVDYEITTSFAPHDIVWFSDNTRIKQMSEASGVAVMRPKNNVKHVGRTYLYLPYAESGSANRGHIVYGNWATGVGFENFHFDEFVFEGGHPNTNAFAVAGGSRNIRGNLLDAGTSTVIGRVFLAHWANFDDHYNSGGIYQHANDATPTTHPHDIYIEEVRGDLTVSAGDFCALWCVAAGYNIRAGRIEGSVMNNGAGPGSLVLFTAGDLGLAYATPEERAQGMAGLEIGSVIGHSSHQGINRIGRALHYDTDSTPQPEENYYAKVREVVGFIDVSNPNGSNIECAVDGFNGYGSSHYQYIISKNFRSSFLCSNHTRNFTVDVVEAIDCHGQAMRIVGSGDDSDEWPADISVGRIIVKGTGRSEASAGQSSVSNIDKANNVNVREIIVDELKDMPSFNSATLSVNANVYGVVVDTILQRWSNPGQTVCVSLLTSADKFVDIRNVIAPQNLIPVSGGQTSRVIGRNREYHYYGGTVPSGLQVRVGDRFVASAAASGQSWLYIVTTGGVTGDSATVTGYMDVP